jgi:hypothetical protein
MSLGVGEMAELDVGPGDPFGAAERVPPMRSPFARAASTSGTST